MPELLVSDTSVLIDLDRGGILASIFDLPFEVGVPDLLFERELSTWDGTDWKQLGLKVLTLDNVGVSLAQTYRARDRRLSAADAFALALAKIGPHMLLAGDGAVRDMASVEASSATACCGSWTNCTDPTFLVLVNYTRPFGQ